MGVPKDPYGLVDPFESDPTDPTTNNNSLHHGHAITLTNNAAAIATFLTTYDVDVYNLGHGGGRRSAGGGHLYP